MKARTLNRAVKAARADAEQHLPALTAIYQAALEQTATRAARAFASMTAASWQPPPEGNILAAAASVAASAAVRSRRLEEEILTVIAEGTSVRLGIAWDVKHPLAQALLAQAGQRTGANIDAAVQPVLRALIADAYQQGLSVTDTSALIRGGLTEAAPWQADMLARTDLNGLANGGSVIAARLAGAPFKTWLCFAPDTLVVTRPPSIRAVARRWHEGSMLRLRAVPSSRLGDTEPADSVLTVTPQHPILVQGRGWIAADDLVVGDQLVGEARQGCVMRQEPDVDRDPVTITELFDAFADVRAPVRVMCAPVDLDGERREREVDVVFADGELLDRCDALGREQVGEGVFALADVALEALFAGGSLAQGRLGHPAPSAASGSLPARGRSFFSPVQPAVPAGGGLVAELDIGEPELSFDGCLSDPEDLGELTSRLAREVETYDLVAIEVIPWRGHVYDLETTTGWLFADGIIAHNSTMDDRTRETHAEADGQTVPVDATFTVGGEQADFPGDPSLSDAEAANCRCTLVYTDSLAASAAAPTLAPGGHMPKLGTAIAKASTNMKGGQRLAAKVAPVLAAMPAGMQEMPAGVKACTMNGTPGYTGGGACHMHDGTETGMRSAMRKAKADAGKASGASLAAASAPGAIPFTGTAAIEGLLTDDSSPTPRVLLAKSLSWPDLPVPFMAQTVTADGHDGAEVAGRIDSFKRVKGATPGTYAIEFKGELTTPFGINEVAPMVADQTLRGVSIDLGAAEYALVDRATLAPVAEADIDLEALASGGYALGLTTGKIRAATLCPVQAIEGANVALAASAAGEAVATFTADIAVVAALVASAAPTLPPAEWFETPEPPGKMPLTISDDGRVFGHLALSDSCHTGLAGVCVTPPRSPSGYAYFHVGEVETAEGRKVPVGKLMLAAKAGRHAPLSASRAEAARHYDDTSMVAAYLRATDGRYGIWVAGALNPALSAERVRELRTLPPSGDWREVNGRLELIAALAVPVPGFPVPRAEAALVASADEVELSALVASSGSFEAEPLVVRALEQAGLIPDERAADARARALLARAEGGVDGLVALAEA